MNAEAEIRNAELEDAAESTAGADTTRAQDRHDDDGRLIAAPAERDEGKSDAEPRDNNGEEGQRSGGAEAENNAELRTPNPELARHYASLCEQGAELAAEIPGFSLDEALRDRDFLRLTSPAVGVSVRGAWYALHGAEREAQAARRAREQAAAALAVSAARPREGGRGLNAGALSAADPRFLDREARSALRQRIYEAASRGEKLYP